MPRGRLLSDSQGPSNKAQGRCHELGLPKPAALPASTRVSPTASWGLPESELEVTYRGGGVGSFVPKALLGPLGESPLRLPEDTALVRAWVPDHKSC